ncbi:hypothetical protein CPB83DRAFT_143443 [Crepidotus variabilis]|uniref:DUF6534 domain-containing protein n=1 Tax=Crepidotus variabilis TaxID=179855 RepID=A0A9P6EKQ3_9AGAR|nr:hypothetical protein CPB83DRAFT_143443 [Crepidotus variabilis]
MVQDSQIRRFAWTIDTFNPLAVVVDSLIAVSICVLLYKNRTGIERTDNLIHTLITYTTGSGLLTSMVATAALVVSLVFPRFIISLALYNINCQLHVNSLLASLNARRSLRERCDPSVVPLAMKKPRTLQSSNDTPQQQTSMSQIVFSDGIAHDLGMGKMG